MAEHKPVVSLEALRSCVRGGGVFEVNTQSHKRVDSLTARTFDSFLEQLLLPESCKVLNVPICTSGKLWLDMAFIQLLYGPFN